MGKINKIQATLDQLVAKNIPITPKTVFPIKTVEELVNAEAEAEKDLQKYVCIFIIFVFINSLIYVFRYLLLKS